MTKLSSLKTLLFFLAMAILSLPLIGSSRALPEFRQVKGETERFMGYYFQLKLTAKEQKVLERALTKIPAPCCADHTALTC